MTRPFAILAPNLDPTQTKLLRAAVTQSRLPWTTPVDALPTDTRFVLSAGRDALRVWHDFGLIRIGANHGDVFRHTHPVTGKSYVVMVIEHPGTMQQLSIVGHEARDGMLRDLRRWGHVLDGSLLSGQPYWCGGCLRLQEPRQRQAEHWVAELDGVGLCDDHYRRRARYRRKVTRVAAKDKGKMEHQIAGQMEMLPGDGTRVRVSKT